jgi:hypothetical protein
VRDQPEPLAKIRSDELRRRAESGDPEGCIVIVEIMLSAEEKILARSPKGGSLGRHLIELAEGSEAMPDRTIEQLVEEVAKITDEPPQRLTSAALAVKANGEQLRHIASIPSVLAIYPN